jgi:hypothetical protein
VSLTHIESKKAKATYTQYKHMTKKSVPRLRIASCYEYPMSSI